MLKDNDIAKLREGTFELECLHMELARGNCDPRDSYVGPGRIYQDAEHQLHFSLYVPDAELRLHTPDLPTGGIIPPDAYWHLTATDYHGRRWHCPRIFVSPGWSQPGGGSIVSSDLPYLEGSETSDRPQTGGSFTGYIFRNLRLPANRRTQISMERDSEWSKSGSWDTAATQVGDVKFLLHQEDEQLRVSAVLPNSSLHPQFAERVREALQFVSAHPVSWAATVERRGQEVKVYIRGRPSPRLSPRIQPPVPRQVAYSEVPTWQLFNAYFAYVCLDTVSEIHRISAEWNEILRSSVSSVEAEALICAIAVESLCRYLQEVRPELGTTGAPNSRDWGDRIDAFLETNSCPNRIRRRVRGLFARMTATDHTDALVSLRESGAVDANLVEAWSRWRPIMAHGDREAQALVQELARGTDAVVTLLYQLYFYTIGYRGMYTDFSQIPWRAASYPPGTTLSDPEHA